MAQIPGAPAGWINRDRQAAIEYLRAENRVLKELLGKKRVLLNDDQRRRLPGPPGTAADSSTGV